MILPSKEYVRESMVNASRVSIKEKTGTEPTEEELDMIRDYYSKDGDMFIETNMNSLKSKCDQIEQASVAIPEDIASIPVELAIPDDLAVGSATTVPNPASVVKKFAQKMNEVKSRILATLVIIEEVYHICGVLHIPVPSPVEAANNLMRKKKEEANNLEVPNVEQ